MLVKELIKKLKRCNPKAELYIDLDDVLSDDSFCVIEPPLEDIYSISNGRYVALIPAT